MRTALSVGQQVRAVKGPRNTMNPEPRYVGRVGEVEHVGPPIDGDYFYRVRFGVDSDYIDHCNLEVV